MIALVSLVIAALCSLVVLVSLVGLPHLARLLPTRSARDANDSQLPSCVVIMSALNEESAIVHKLENLLEEIRIASDIAPHIDVVLVDDGSSDRTHELASAFAIDLRRNSERQGVARSVDAVLSMTSSDIIVLTDVGTTFAEGSLRALLKPLLSGDVGCVTGVLDFTSQSHQMAGGFSAYWAYETELRRELARSGNLTTASGAIMAYRRAVVPRIPEQFAGDAYVPMMVAASGLLVAQADGAIGHDEGTASVEQERDARVRMVARNLSCIRHVNRTHIPLRKNRVLRSVVYFHKTAKWYTPVLLCVAGLAVVGFFATWSLTAAAVLVTAAVVVIGALALLGPRSRPSSLVAKLWSFAIIQWAFLKGIAASFQGERFVVYDKSS